MDAKVRRRAWIAGGVALVLVGVGAVLGGAFSRSRTTDERAATDSATPAAPVIPNRPNCGPAPSACGLPDATNTGVPPGTELSTIDGNLTITEAGTVVDGKHIKGCVEVRAANVIIRRSKITCTGFAAILQSSDDGGLLVEDAEIDCGNHNSSGISSSGFTARRLNVHSCENGFDISHDVTVSDSYIHDLYEGATGHADGAQLSQGGNVTIVHNTIYNPGGTSAIITPRSGTTDIFIGGNLMGGGAYTLYCPRDSSANFRVINNRITTTVTSKGGAYGPWVYCAKVAKVEGNVWDNTLQPLAAD